MKVWQSLKAILLILSFTWRTSDSTPDFNAPHARTTLGLFRGTKVPVLTLGGGSKYSTVKQFLGVPYAKTPKGADLRFRRPEPAEPFDHVHIADFNQDIYDPNRPFPACIRYLYQEYNSSWGGGEDCLFLNIWTPVERPRKLPVLFWIHPFYIGPFDVPITQGPTKDGRVLAAEGEVVVVTVNYRTGFLGFLTSGTEEAPGNYGLYDILEALKWVNKHIEAFGGDPGQVTLAGQGTGAQVVGLLCVSPLTTGLFHRVIMESGSPAYFMLDNSLEVSVSASQNIAKMVGCADDTNTISNDAKRVVSCLRGKDPLLLSNALNSFHPNMSVLFSPHYGDEILPKTARRALIDGNFHGVPVLIGTNKDEDLLDYARYWAEFQLLSNDMEKLMKSTYKEENVFKDILWKALLPIFSIEGKDYQYLQEFYDSMRDYFKVCPTVYFAESYSGAGNDVHFYYFTHHPSTNNTIHYPEFWGSVHSNEVQFVFGLPLSDPVFNPREYLLSDKMIDVWANFVKTGSTGIPEWPSYSRLSPIYFVLNSERYEYKDRFKRFGQGPHKKSCDFFRTYFGFD